MGSFSASGFDFKVQVHPPRHCEIRLSLTQLCGFNATAATGLGSVCAALGVNSPLPHRGLGIEAWLHREAAMMPPTASQRRPAHRVSLRGHRCRGKDLRKQKIDSETTARQFENATFNCQMSSPSSTLSHPLSITCNREERSEG